MSPYSQPIEWWSFSFFSYDITLRSGCIWVLSQLIDMALYHPGIVFIQALHVFPGLGSDCYFESYTIASFVMLPALPYLSAS
jgi:hypothetical protein